MHQKAALCSLDRARTFKLPRWVDIHTQWGFLSLCARECGLAHRDGNSARKRTRLRARSMGLTYLILLKKTRKRRQLLETKLFEERNKSRTLASRGNNSKYNKETISLSGREQSKASASGVCSRCESTGRRTSIRGVV
jgi:hypothetical protein